jgi:glutamate synthase (NADPH/NADH)
MKARQGMLKHASLPLDTLFPIIEPNGSDSAAFDNVLDFLVQSGHLSLPEAVAIMIPEAVDHPERLPERHCAFIEWSQCVMEPWDGPALVTFADGRYVGACLDRNGLRPCRYYLLDNNILVCASEVGTVPIDPASVKEKVWFIFQGCGDD